MSPIASRLIFTDRRASLLRAAWGALYRYWWAPVSFLLVGLWWASVVSV